MGIKNFKRTKYSCYFAYIAMSSVFSMPPLLFATFRQMYNISYTLLGTLVLINFCTQFAVDLVFTLFSKYLDIHKTIRIMPLITTLGLAIYALIPLFLPQYAYLGLAVGTVVFSVAAGISEVLLSPVIAALPSKNPDRDMAKLHLMYAYGVLSVILITTIFLNVFGAKNWVYLALFFGVFPVISSYLFFTSPLPQINLAQSTSKKSSKKRRIGLLLLGICIFSGGAAELLMSNWISVYMEKALNIPKEWGDIVGMAVFAGLLGIGRTLYARFGKNIAKVLLLSMLGASVCYITAGVVSNAVVSVLACVLTGICTSMLWPGTLILMEEKISSPGVAAYALMASCADFGGSVAPQMLGVVIDKISISKWAGNLGEKLLLSPEQIGMKTGMFLGAVFPLIGVFVVAYMIRFFKKNKFE